MWVSFTASAASFRQAAAEMHLCNDLAASAASAASQGEEGGNAAGTTVRGQTSSGIERSWSSRTDPRSGGSGGAAKSLLTNEYSPAASRRFRRFAAACGRRFDIVCILNVTNEGSGH